jgi:hypothetical protein
VTKQQNIISRLKPLEVEFGQCTCSSTDKDNLSAEYCDEDGNCEPCQNTISCGYFKPWTTWSDCSASCAGGIQTRQQEFISATSAISSDIETEERACSTDVCPSWGDWRPWDSCSATCWDSGSNRPQPSQQRYRCWEMTDGSKNCGSKEAEPGQGELCGRLSSELCYETQERPCNVDEACSVACEWTQWSAYSSTCTPDCADGIRISRRSNNEDEGAFCPAGDPSIRTIPCDLTTKPCDDCYNQYDKCDRISTSYCTDVRYADRLERLCQKHCGHCSSRKRRRRRRIQSEETASYEALDALLIGLSLR